MNIVSVTRPTALQLVQQWDQIADTRLRQISSGSDTSFRETLLPAVLEEIPPNGRVLDLGCGIGALSAEIAEIAGDVTAIDPSPASIALASENFRRPNLEFAVSTAEGVPASYHDRFDAVVSNMVLMDVIDLDGVLARAREVSRLGAKFIATLTHPCFWPHYFGYHDAPWFEYDREIFVKAPFRIANEATDFDTVHVHRPLSFYFSALTTSGFRDIRVTELYGSGSFAFPRFIRLVATAD